MRYFLYVVALAILVYPFWGIVAPQSYLVELLETYPLAKQANSSQIKLAAGQLLISNVAFAFAIFLLAKFIQFPQQYYRAKYAAILFICYPFMLSLVEALNSAVLYEGVDGAHFVVELSAMKLFYIVFGIIIIGVYQSQRKLSSVPQD